MKQHPSQWAPLDDDSGCHSTEDNTTRKQHNLKQGWAAVRERGASSSRWPRNALRKLHGTKMDDGCAYEHNMCDAIAMCGSPKQTNWLFHRATTQNTVTQGHSGPKTDGCERIRWT